MNQENGFFKETRFLKKGFLAIALRVKCRVRTYDNKLCFYLVVRYGGLLILFFY